MEHQQAHIVLIEDLPEVREGLREMLNNSGRFGCVCAYGSAEQMFLNGALNEAGLFILDIGLPGMDGLECLVRLKAVRPDAKVLMFTVMEHDEKVFAALKAGADGYLLKRESPEKILEAIADALNGGAPMSSEIARRVLISFRAKPLIPNHQPLLSEREKEVLGLLSKGHLYKEIADQLEISLNTVKQHIHHIYEKLQVQNRTEAVIKYLGS
ncbi:MAG: response regulator transcription factor [Saprospiraceae bacterium]|nr:response regulator transcription factor [Saprospiraceae bacterium]